ncbi:HAMP domain-containing histidine kinase [Cohnella ginsengisoli]|uniref:histidine kinase n=1 Tax=Cohnella ginsengisoli TaxID=425004 RepID=A0A9X4KF90_9BACL|nr:HAMP domain-containing sensor histidine kinase [Cohnella ginsengisoli]MDG0790696.1 HAMP domain-containing histidine kinase [Cohnella ginsengisoli]
MRISIKLKTSVFLAALLLLTVLVMSLLVLRGIQNNQRAQVEQFMAQQASTANTYLYQSLTAESNKVPETYLASKGAEFGRQLEQISGQTIELYDADGKAIYKNKSGVVSEGIGKTLAYALQRKTAYLVEDDALYYLAPLNVGNEQVGVVQFYYDLAANAVFYDQIKRLFEFIGAGTFLLSFILAYFYFNALSGSIIKLNQAVNRIREGSYDTAGVKRRDEIGELGEGIRAMSERIRQTIRDKDDEREKLKLAVDKLSKLDEQQKQFIGNVTHEFKTPLTSIKAYLDLMDMYPDDESLLQTAKANIAGDTQRLYEMVEKVLRLSALEKYDFEFTKEKVDVRRTIASVLDSLQGKMDKFGLRLETNLAEASADADGDSLTIVLMNLLDNAIKYNKTKGSIRISCEERDGQVVIEIADTGIGIPQTVAHKIFEPFYTVDKNRSRENGGAGLGLSLAKKYAEMQGGSIALVRSGEEGTTFRIAYPVWSDRQSS